MNWITERQYSIKNIRIINRDMRKNFYKIFKVNADGSIQSDKIWRMSGLQVFPGTTLGRGVIMGKIDLHDYVGRDLEIRKEKDVYVITGIY